MLLTVIVLLMVGLLVELMVLTVAALRSSAGRRKARTPLRERIRRYVGPVKPESAVLSPGKCVALEFFTALCGFPGIGWLMSTRVFVGLLLFSIVPSFVWGFYPVYLCCTRKIALDPFLTIRYLPILAAASAGALAAHQLLSPGMTGISKNRQRE